MRGLGFYLFKEAAGRRVVIAKDTQGRILKLHRRVEFEERVFRVADRNLFRGSGVGVQGFGVRGTGFGFRLGV